MTKLALDIDDETLAQLKLMAEREGRTLEEIARDGLALIAANDMDAADLPATRLTPEDVALIEEGLAQLDRDEGVSHEEAMQRVRAQDS